MQNRRAMLLSLGGLGAEIVVGLIGLSLLGTDAAGTPPDQNTTFRYRNRNVKIQESGDMVMASVDGRMVHIDISPQRRYHSHLLPFQDYPNARQLLPVLIDLDAAKLVVL